MDIQKQKMQDESHIGKIIKSKNLIEVKWVRHKMQLTTGAAATTEKTEVSCLHCFWGEYWSFGNLGGVYVVLHTVSILLAHSIIFKLSALYV